MADLAAVASVLAHMAGRDQAAVVSQIRQMWLRARMAPPPTGAVKVREARARLLGVHTAIRVDGSDGDLPAYVPRDLDPPVRAAVAAAADRGGFVLLVGGSCVGKTRALFEAIRAVLPEWWLVHPESAVHRGSALPSRTVVWLDDLQRHMDHHDRMPVAVARDLIAGGSVLAGTLLTDEYHRRTTSFRPGHPDLNLDRGLLDLADVIPVADTLSPAELRRAGEVARADVRIRAVLPDPDHRVIQALTAGPDLIRWWEQATDPYGKAIITAAIDARRLHVAWPLSPGFLTAAASGYLTAAQRASASADWLQHALAYATTVVRGAGSVLSPIGHEGMGEVDGYLVTDFVFRHAAAARRCVRPPASFWTAAAQHIDHIESRFRLARAADARLIYEHAERLYRGLAAEASTRSGDARSWLADHLARTERLEELLACAQRGDEPAKERLPAALAEAGRRAEAVQLLEAWSASGDWRYSMRLMDFLVEHDMLGHLRRRADAGDQQAAARLNKVLAERNQLDELADRADNDDLNAASWLAATLADRGDLDRLRQRADRGDNEADERLADLLARTGAVDELSVRAAAGSGAARHALPRALAEQGRVDDAVAMLTDEADRWRLLSLLADNGRLDELRTYAATDQLAKAELARALHQDGRLDELADLARDGCRFADEYHHRTLATLGRVEELRELAEANEHAALVLLDLLIGRGDLDEASSIVEAFASASVKIYMKAFTILTKRLVSVESRVAAGPDETDGCDVLAAQGRIDELRSRADAGHDYAANHLVKLLFERGDVEQMRREVDAGTHGAAGRLIELLQRQKKSAEARALRRYGLSCDGRSKPSGSV